MKWSVLVTAGVVAVATSAASVAHAFFFVIPIPNVAKPPQLQALIDALEKSSETKAVAYTSEDKTFGSKYWVWGHFAGHVLQPEADRRALESCEASLRNARNQSAGGTSLYDFGQKRCELYQFENQSVSSVALANASQPAQVASASPPPPTVKTGAMPSAIAGTWCLISAEDALPQCVFASWSACHDAKPTQEARCQAQPYAEASQNKSHATPLVDSSTPPTQPPVPVATQAREVAVTPVTAPAGAAPAVPTPAESPSVKRLRELQQLRKEGLITEQEYNEKRKAVLSTL
jgi:hypothetical protein